MTIQLNFTNATYVSMNEMPDSLIITFWAHNLFVDLNGTTFAPKQIRRKYLPPQIPLDQVSLV